MGSGDQVQVSFGALASAASSIGSQAQQIQQQLDDLKDDVKRVLGSYEGQAAENYRVAQDAWDKSAADIQQILASIGVAIRDAGEAYEASERANAQRW